MKMLRFDLKTTEKKSLTLALKEAGVILSKPCGGIGRCRRCRVRFIYGASDITSDDDSAFEYEELMEGWRLGCMAVISKDCAVEIPANLIDDGTGCGEASEDGTTDETVTAGGGISQVEKAPRSFTDLGIAIDLGTTTIAGALVDLSSWQVIADYSIGNSQRSFGADVVSRITASLKGSATELQQAVVSDIKAVIAALCDKCQVSKAMIDKGIISGNTAMIHLLLNYPVEGLAAYPFKAHSLGFEMFSIEDISFTVMKGISPFVGGDIVSGLFVTEMFEKEGLSLLVDIGTNGEMVLFDGKQALVASTAAGPALEAAGISCGVPAVKGAISKVEFVTPKQIRCKSIDDEEPIGLCGSAVVDLVAGLFEQGVIDEGGLFRDDENAEGFKVADEIIFTPEDVQQVLLAKSAIYSGIMVLLEKAGVADAGHQIDRVFLAGGLGAAINLESAFKIGLLPKELRDKTLVVGNSSLDGAVKFLCKPEMEKIEEMVEKAEVVELAQEPQFETLFLSNLFL